jgi:hypothetical protein
MAGRSRKPRRVLDRCDPRIRVVGDGKLGDRTDAATVGWNVAKPTGAMCCDGEVGHLFAFEKDLPLAMGRRFRIASASCDWPLPSTPAMPTISPRWTSRETSAHLLVSAGRRALQVATLSTHSPRRSGCFSRAG